MKFKIYFKKKSRKIAQNLSSDASVLTFNIPVDAVYAAWYILYYFCVCVCVFFWQIYSMDVTSGGLAVSSDSEGKLKIWETANGTVRVSILG